MVYDDASRKWLTFDAQGRIEEAYNSLLSRYAFFDTDLEEWNDYVYANSDAILLPATSLYPERILKPEKGKVSALVGDSNEYLTIQDNGRSLCYSSRYHHMGQACISVDDDIIPNSDKSANNSRRFILLTRGHSSAVSGLYFVISRIAKYYQIHEISYAQDPKTRKTSFAFSEISLSLSTEDVIIDFDSDGRSFFIAFEKNGIKKFSIDQHRKVPIKENKDFYKNAQSILGAGKISAVKLDRSVSERTRYVTFGNAVIYRLSMDGIPDYQIRITEK